jgi:hypothetical protein
VSVGVKCCRQVLPSTVLRLAHTRARAHTHHFSTSVFLYLSCTFIPRNLSLSPLSLALSPLSLSRLPSFCLPFSLCLCLFLSFFLSVCCVCVCVCVCVSDREMALSGMWSYKIV